MGNIPTGGPCGDRDKPLSVCVSDFFFSNLESSDIPTSPTSGLVSILSVELNRLTDENAMLISEIKRRKTGSHDGTALSGERDLLKTRLNQVLRELEVVRAELDLVNSSKKACDSNICALRKEFSTVQGEASVLKQTVDSLSELNRTLKRELAELKSVQEEHFKGLELQNSKLTSELSRVQHRQREREARYKLETETLKLEKDVLKWEIEALTKDKSQLVETNSQEKACFESNIRYIESQKEKMRVSMQLLQLENSDLSSKNQLLQSELQLARPPLIVRTNPVRIVGPSRQDIWHHVDDTKSPQSSTSRASPTSPLFGG